jgi:hypothetical protein
MIALLLLLSTSPTRRFLLNQLQRINLAIVQESSSSSRSQHQRKALHLRRQPWPKVRRTPLLRQWVHWRSLTRIDERPQWSPAEAYLGVYNIPWTGVSNLPKMAHYRYPGKGGLPNMFHKRPCKSTVAS